MKIREIVTIPARQEERVVTVRCDLCSRLRSGYLQDWSEESYEVDSVRIEAERGSCDPEGDSTEKTIVDLCPPCFYGKFMPWVTSQGAVPTVEKINTD